MIVVTGATGALNGATVDHLLELVPAAHVAVAVRNPAKAGRFLDRGVDVRHGDYSDPGSLLSAFAGAEQVLLVSSNDPGADAVSLHCAAIEAAVAAGASRILYTSHQGAAPANPFPPARGHAATEKLLERSGVAWTSLRNGYYAHSLAFLLGSWRETGIISIPADGPVSWTARADLAEAAAVILASAGGYDGSVTLAASAAPTFADLAVTCSEISGRPVECDVVGTEAWVAAKVAQGQPEPTARFTASIFEAAHEGFFAGVDPLLPRILGREPRTARQELESHLARPTAETTPR